MGRPPDSDGDLAARARDGDLAAYSDLVRRYERLAFRVAWLVCRSSAEAEEAAQEGFIKAYRALGRLREGAEFRPWLLKIVANQAKNRVRSAARRARYESLAAIDPTGATQSAETAAVAREGHSRLLAAVDELPDKERLIVACRYLLDFSEAETAAVAGVPRGTVKSRLARAMGRLRAQLTEADLA